MVGYLSVINKPNILGAGCEFDLYGVNLMGGKSNSRLPTFIQSYPNDPEYNYNSHCFGKPTQFTIVNTHGIDSVRWKFNDWGNYPDDTSTLFSPQYTFSAPGTYYPLLTVWSGVQERFVKDTVVIYAVPAPDLGSDTLFCPDSPFSLSLNGGPIGQYFWNGSQIPGDSLYIVTDTGTYYVKVNNHGCIGRDTINVSIYDPATASGGLITPAD
jgi:PKD repeat protein